MQLFHALSTVSVIVAGRPVQFAPQPNVVGPDDNGGGGESVLKQVGLERMIDSITQSVSYALEQRFSRT
jgi:hypothetical protein